MRRLIVTADDFGLAPEVNEAVETAHRTGILTSASLMVAAPAAQDAVARARRLSSLKVGLHIVLVDGRPASPASIVPDLVDAAGRFRNDMVRLGVEIFALARVRRQIAVEIAAQFDRFATTGLALDHVDAHRHFHLHPSIADLICRIGEGYGMKALRAPVEPARVLSRIVDASPGPVSLLTTPFAIRLRRRLRRRGLAVADQVFGLAWSGAMTRARLIGLLTRLPDGVTEIYGHPAVSDRFAGAVKGYRYAEEFAALINPETAAAVHALGIRLAAYSDLAGS